MGADLFGVLVAQSIQLLRVLLDGLLYSTPLIGFTLSQLAGLTFEFQLDLFSLPLSRRFERVVAVEDERRACTLGRVNVKTNRCDNVTYLRATTEQFLRDNKERPDLVLMDPPRLGAKPALPMLLQLRAKRLVYVSCDPQTLARDLRQLVDGGYVLEQVEGYDMFPQTFHVEAVARLRLAAP